VRSCFNASQQTQGRSLISPIYMNKKEARNMCCLHVFNNMFKYLDRLLFDFLRYAPAAPLQPGFRMRNGV
jgi:hypothetical protein